MKSNTILKDVKYNMAYLDFVEGLTTVSDQMLFKPGSDGKKVHLNRSTAAQDFAFILKANIDAFSVPEEGMGILSFSRFKKCLDFQSKLTGSNPLIQVKMESFSPEDEEDDKNWTPIGMQFSTPEGEEEFYLSLGDPEIGKFKSDVPDEMPPIDEDLVVNLTLANLMEIQKKIFLIRPSYIELRKQNGVFDIVLFNLSSADYATCSIKEIRGSGKDFSLKFSVDSFNLIPSGDYLMTVDAEGCAYLCSHVSDELDMDLSIAIFSKNS